MANILYSSSLYFLHLLQLAYPIYIYLDAPFTNAQLSSLISVFIITASQQALTRPTPKSRILTLQASMSTCTLSSPSESRDFPHPKAGTEFETGLTVRCRRWLGS